LQKSLSIQQGENKNKLLEPWNQKLQQHADQTKRQIAARRPKKRQFQQVSWFEKPAATIFVGLRGCLWSNA
jgi:hypothetical protein